MLTIDTRQVQALSSDLVAATTQAVNRVAPIVRHHGQLLESRVKANASTGYHSPGQRHIPGTGPGPNVATGDYRRSIGPVEIVTEGSVVSAVLGSAAPQAARLEYGFVGTDSRGRHYAQPPFPHFGPGIDEQATLLESDLIAMGIL